MKIENGVLICLYVTPQGDTSPIKQLVVPKSLRDTILDCLHAGVAGGHLGQAKTLSKLKARFYWPGHYKDMEYWCCTCPDCASRKTPIPHQKAPLSSVMNNRWFLRGVTLKLNFIIQIRQFLKKSGMDLSMNDAICDVLLTE